MENIPKNFFRDYLEQRSQVVKKSTARKELKVFKYILEDFEDRPKNLFKKAVVSQQIALNARKRDVEYFLSILDGNGIIKIYE